MHGQISGGLGDDLTVEELVASHEGLARHIAGRMQQAHAPFDDLVQEARIALWRAAPKYPGHTMRGGLASTIVQRRLIEVVKRETWLGHSRKPGEENRVKRWMVSSIEAVLEAAGTETLREIAEEDAAIDAAEWGYHHGEVFAALATLTDRQRRYVFRRFWLMESESEMAADEGWSKPIMQGEWQRQIRPVLAERLGHLVS